MADEHDWEEFADDAIGELHEFIHLELHYVEKVHGLIGRLHSFGNVLAHFDERLPSHLTNLVDLHREIAEKLGRLIDLVESDQYIDIRIEREEQRVLHDLEDDVKHRDWKAVKNDLGEESEDIEKGLRLKIKELKELHDRFKEIRELMERGNLIEALSADKLPQQTKAEYVKVHEYYFVQFYNFTKAYENIFRQLWEKERAISEQLKKQTKT